MFAVGYKKHRNGYKSERSRHEFRFPHFLEKDNRCIVSTWDDEDIIFRFSEAIGTS